VSNKFELYGGCPDIGQPLFLKVGLPQLFIAAKNFQITAKTAPFLTVSVGAMREKLAIGLLV
jgi:hypothetical protein